MHLVFIPVIHKKDKNGNEISKIACSEYWKGKDSYRQLQNGFYKYVTENGFDLERGNTKDNIHMPIETLKQVTNYNNIKYELEQEEIKPLETQNTALILQQNQELVTYANRLKLQLSKSCVAIEKAEKLQRENASLKHENATLRKANNKLANYLNATFKVVKHLFDFPIDTFKRIVNNFVKSMEK